MAPQSGAWLSVPTRYGANLRASRAMATRLRLLIKGDPEPDATEWNRLGQALWRGDPLADALADWVQAQGRSTAWALFERALAGDETVLLRSDTGPLRDFMLSARTIPPWLNPEQLKRGAQALQSTGLHGMMVLRDAGLMAGYQASAINQTLLRTGALQGGARRRVSETALWWLACTEDNGMAQGQAGFQITLRVRLAHALVRRRVAGLSDWDADRFGVPINQLDMQATYLAFSVVQLLALQLTGVLLNRQQSDDVMHLWRYIGWLMGVEDGLLCQDEAEGRILLYRNLISQAPADDTSRVLARALMNEPLHRYYGWGDAWRGRFNRALHLSLVRWFIGSQGMKDLGLPATTPWYPLLLLFPLALRSGLLHALPWLKPVWRIWARRQQTAYLRILKNTQRHNRQSDSTLDSLSGHHSQT